MQEPTLDEWVAWAEEFYQCMRPDGPIRAPSHICFYARQGALGYVRAAMVAASVQATRVDQSLLTSYRMLSSAEPRFSALRECVARLNPYTLGIRTPGRSPSEAQAGRALEASLRLRAFIREALGLDP